MTDKKSIFDGADFLYAEQLQGKRVTLTIKSVKPLKIVGDGGRTDMGFEMAFEETPKKYAFAAKTVRRQIALALGEDYEKYAGQKITLYPVKQAKSISGQAIRVAIPEQTA